jgi:FdhD protein
MNQENRKAGKEERAMNPNSCFPAFLIHKSPRLGDPAVDVALERIRRGETIACEDAVAVEEPLEIRVEGRSIAVVMRTPGDDRELAAGFLLTEGIVKSAADIFDITHCVEMPDRAARGNVIDVALTNPDALDLEKLTRHFFTASSCGICGKASIEAVRQYFPPVGSDAFTMSAKLLLQLPARLAAAQTTFQQTGGLHACALFDAAGSLVALREDVGRHNALDKLLGFTLLNNLLPLRSHTLLLSGRVSFEMVQKALAGGIAMVAAISAPTSLAVEFARANGQTLIGFLRGETMNLYAGAERVLADPAQRP